LGGIFGIELGLGCGGGGAGLGLIWGLMFWAGSELSSFFWCCQDLPQSRSSESLRQRGNFSTIKKPIFPSGDL
jgi:hypothetical protein